MDPDPSRAVRIAAPDSNRPANLTLTSVFSQRGDLPTSPREIRSRVDLLSRSALGGVDQVAEGLGHAADGFLVALLRQAQAVAVLAVGLDHPVDVLPRLPVRIRRLRHDLSVGQP